MSLVPSPLGSIGWSTRTRWVCGALGVVLSSACAMSPPKVSQTQYNRLKFDLRKKQDELSASRRESAALAAQLKAAETARLAAVRTSVGPAPPPVAAQLTDVPDDGAATSEQYLYSKVLESFRTKDIASFKKSQFLLLKSCPDSPFADNVAHLEGELALAAGDGAQALRVFDLALARYPSGNKASAILLGRARALEKLNRTHQSIDALRLLRQRFPGSPEALRADAELSSAHSTVRRTAPPSREG